jgi:hypothetical protein
MHGENLKLIFILFDNKQQYKIFGSDSNKNLAIVFSFKFLRDAIFIVWHPPKIKLCHI